MAIKKYIHDIDLVTNKLTNARMHPVTTTERLALVSVFDSGDEGVLVYDTTLKIFFVWGGSEWTIVGTTVTDIKSDYDFNITGSRNSLNKLYTLSDTYIPGTTRVFVNGIRYTPGINYDYTEISPNQILFTNAPDDGDLITVDYIKS